MSVARYSEISRFEIIKKSCSEVWWSGTGWKQSLICFTVVIICLKGLSDIHRPMEPPCDSFQRSDTKTNTAQPEDVPRVKPWETAVVWNSSETFPQLVDFYSFDQPCTSSTDAVIFLGEDSHKTSEGQRQHGWSTKQQQQPPVKSIVSAWLCKQISMTNPRSSSTLRSDRVENLQRGGGKRQKLKAADLAECTKTSGSESRSARCFPRTMTCG